MKKSVLKLEPDLSTGCSDRFRTAFKTKHGRSVFLSLELSESCCHILDCFYIDRNQGRLGGIQYNSKPKKLKSFRFPAEALLPVIAAELDKQFYGMEFVTTGHETLAQDEFIRVWLESAFQKYRFLIMVGEGETQNGLPVRLRTRLKNKVHRSIFVELGHYKDGQGIVKQCNYYDRRYKRDGAQITPPMLISCFFPYTKESILALVNNELYCDFTHLIITDGIDLDSNTTPLCGAL